MCRPWAGLLGAAYLRISKYANAKSAFDCQSKRQISFRSKDIVPLVCAKVDLRLPHFMALEFHVSHTCPVLSQGREAGLAHLEEFGLLYRRYALLWVYA